jgi:hypothetical protein
MKCRTRIHVGGACLVAVAIAVWAATGAEGFTRWPDERLANADAPPAPGENELLAEAGFSGGEEESPPPNIHSRFALGLLPSGADVPHLLSVASVVGAAAAASCLSVVTRRCCGARVA